MFRPKILWFLVLGRAETSFSVGYILGTRSVDRDVFLFVYSFHSFRQILCFVSTVHKFVEIVLRQFNPKAYKYII